MNKQTDEEILETLKGWHALSAQPYKPPTMADRDRLAEKLFATNCYTNLDPKPIAQQAIEAAKIFFDALESNDE